MVRLPLLAASAEAPAASHDLPLLLGGTAVSTIGTSLTLLAVTIHLRPEGAGWIAAVMAAELVPAGAVVSLVAVGIGWLIGGVAGSVQRVALTALVRERTPDAERGRVFAAIHAVVQAGNLAGLAVGAAVVGLIGARSSLLLSGALTALAGAAMWWIGRSALRR